MRINCIPVEFLTDQHLRAEWVEMLMLPAFMKRSLKSKHGFSIDTSTKYTLNNGHAKFFYNKLNYVKKRYKEIEAEMRKRLYEANPCLDLSMFPEELFNDWTPTKEDMVVNANRILTRIKEKPTWYTYYRNDFENNSKKSFESWIDMYDNWLDFKYELKDSDLKRS